MNIITPMLNMEEVVINYSRLSVMSLTSTSASWASSSISSSYALSASWAPSGGGITPGGSYDISASWASRSLWSTTSSYASASTSASYLIYSPNNGSASYAVTASFALNGGSGTTTTAYTTIFTSSTQWITCSFLDSKEYVDITLGQLYNFTCSNVPTSGQIAEVSLFINNTATTQTSSLSFPSNWKFLGSKPNAITSSKCAILSLQSYGPSIQVAGFSIQY